MNHRRYDLGFEMNRAHRRDLGEVRAQERLARQATTTPFEIIDPRAPTMLSRAVLRLATVLRRGTVAHPAPNSLTS